MEETFWRDDSGYWRERTWVFFLVGMVLFIIVVVTGMVAIGDYYEVQAFNRIHGTDYTFGEWFWAQYTIKDYHLGTVENKNYQVDLNVNKVGEE